MFNWSNKDTKKSRATTCQLIEKAQEGVISWEALARDLLGWISEAEVKEFAEHQNLIEDEESEDDTDEWNDDHDDYLDDHIWYESKQDNEV